MKHPDRTFRVDDAILHTVLLLALLLTAGWTAELNQRTR